MFDDEPGPARLELSAGGTKLYTVLSAVLSAGDGLAVIDTTTLAGIARYSTTHLARTGALIWYGYGCVGTFTGKIGKLDTAVATPVPVGRLQGNARFRWAPLLAATGTDAGPLVAGQLALSSSMVQTYTVQNRLFVIGPHDNQPVPSLTVVTAATGT